MVVLAPWIWLKFSDKPEYPERTAGLGKIAIVTVTLFIAENRQHVVAVQQN